jgi:tetratricopeptide (TPR) repeat protein
MASPVIGRTLGQYRILEEIGSGGMGVVYRARDERLERDVALKILPQGLLAGEVARRRFRREALALSKLTHPNIATIHDFDSHEGIDFLVMEYIPGVSLSDKIAGGPLPEPEFLHLGVQLASALGVAHEHGVVHRDLKPANLRVTPDGWLKVLDFGLAKSLLLESETTTDTAGERLAGTPPYMAPEQLRGEPADHRSDIYAAGMVLYEMAAGRRPFPDAHGARLISAILHDSPPPPSASNPRLSRALDGIILKALDKDPALRYQSARELAVDLARQGAPTVMGMAVAQKRRRGRRRRALTVAGVVASVLVLGWVGYHRRRPPPEFPARGRALIADFDNRTGDASLDHAIRTELTIQLQQSRYVNVVSREQIFDALRRMQRADLRQIDEPTGLEICLRENISLLLVGSIQGSGETRVVSVRGIRPDAHANLFVVREQFVGETESFDAVNRLARGVREALGEPLTAGGPSLAKVTTRSLKALNQYSRAADAMARGNTEAVRSLLDSALELDPDFAMAHRLMARVYLVLGNRERELEHLARAYALRENLNERERHFVEASYYRGQGAYDKALERLATLASLYPDDMEAHYALALAYRDAGSSRRAVEELQEVVQLNPFFTDACGNLVLLLARVNQNDRALAVYEEARRREVQSPRLEWGLGMALLGQGKLSEARERFRQLQDRGGIYEGTTRLYLAAADIYEGKLGAAIEQLYAGIRLDQKLRNRPPERVRRYLLARIFLVRGEPGPARTELRALVAPGPESLGPEELQRAGTLYAWLKDLSEARRLLNQLELVRNRIASSYSESCYHNLAGEVALAEGRTRQAVESFLSATAEYEGFVSDQGLARAYTAQRDWTRAREKWQQVIDARGQVFHSGFPADLVLAHLYLGRVLRRLNDLESARSHYQVFLQVWDRADELSVRREALAERQRVGG